MGKPDLYYESVVIDGYMRSLEALYGLRGVVKNGAVDEDHRDQAKALFRGYIRGLRQAAEELFPGDTRYAGSPVKLLEEMIAEMRDLARELGCRVD